ncbi:reverse transcriptase domain-containing protein [Tanacetum coccineum]
MLNECEDYQFGPQLGRKSHFIGKGRHLFLDSKSPSREFDVDRATVVVIAAPSPLCERCLRKRDSIFLLKGVYRIPLIHLKKINEAPILIAPDWDLPFELMCDASDFAIGAVLGQRKNKHFQPIHYASKTMTEAQAHYTTTEKEFSCRSMLSQTDAVDPFAPRILDRGTHFCNDQFAKVMLKYGVTHRLSRVSPPDNVAGCEVSNRGLKRILERTVGENRASWSDKLDDALWAFHTAYKTPIGYTPYKLAYGKACHLPIELEHQQLSGPL